MRAVIFDVSNGSCALAVCPNGYSVMFDCGSHNDTICPVDYINHLKKTGNFLGHMQSYNGYDLTKLVVSHPDLDHIKNIEKVHTELEPYLLHRRKLEEFPSSKVDQDDENYKYYRDKVDAQYTGKNPVHPNWGFAGNKNYRIPMAVLRDNPDFDDSKIKNNSSIIYILEHSGVRILFGGDLEQTGWNWLIENNHNGFRDDISNGVDILIAPHHGHTSGYSQELINYATPKLVILSKGSEHGEETDVDSRYSSNATGMSVYNLKTESSETKYTITTRSNGNIFLNIDSGTTPNIYTEK